MKKIILTIAFVLIATTALADKIQIPYTCWPDEIVKEAKKFNLKIEKTESVRFKDSFGYIKNLGSSYEIYTYRPVTAKDLEDIKTFATNVELRMR